MGTHPNGAPVYVDYAHTPDALETVLNALRPHTTGKLVVVFGCGGDRDRGKRRLMGEQSIALADRVIVTDDNPRTENAADIPPRDFARGYWSHRNRRPRSGHSTCHSNLQPGDVLLLAGKGHENGQIVGTTIIPFSDADVARHHLREVRA